MATLAELWDSNQSAKDFTQFPQSRGVSDTHKGIDYKTPMNTPIAANISGTVRYKTNDPKGYGNAIEILDDKGNVVQRYAHLNEFSVPNGSKIEAGQILGKSGNTGRSTGPHLHFEDFQSKYANKQTGETLADLWDKTPTIEVKQPQVEAPRNETPLSKVNAVQNLGQKLIGNVTGVTPDTAEFVAKDLAAKFDNTVGSVLPFFTKKISQAGTRFLGADKAAEISDKLTSYVDKPVGKAFGITNDPVYQNEALGKIMNFIGENKEKGDQWIANKTGINKNDVAFFTDLAAIKAGEVGAKATGKAAGQISQQFEEAKKEFPVAGMNKPVTKPTVTLEPLESQNVPKVETLNEPTIKAQRNVSVLPENPILPEAPISSAEINSKKQLLQEIGIDKIRNSALEGNYKDASSQYITSKADNGPYAQGMAEQLQHEKEALTKHFGTIESELGGIVPRRGTSFEVSDEISRGKVVKKAFDEALEAHQQKTTELYNKASEEVGAVPVELTELKDYLDKNSNFVHAPEKSLRKGVNDYLKEQDLLDAKGQVKPMTVGQSEKLRQFINKQYNFETKGKVGDLVNKIDDDVFKNVQGQTYEEARAHFKAGKEIYDNPKAIRDLMSDEGVNQKIADKNVMNKIATIDESQFGHLIDTLRETGKLKAISEIQTALVNRIKEAGKSEVGEPFNVRAAATERAKLSEKLNIAFADNPKLLDQIDKGIEAGNILYVPTRYPGSAVQTQLLKNKFSEMALQKAGTVLGGGAGSLIGGPVGGAIGAAGGEYLGGKGSSLLKSGRQNKQLEKEIQNSNKTKEQNKTKLKDFPNLKD